MAETKELTAEQKTKLKDERNALMGALKRNDFVGAYNIIRDWEPEFFTLQVPDSPPPLHGLAGQVADGVWCLRAGQWLIEVATEKGLLKEIINMQLQGSGYTPLHCVAVASSDDDSMNSAIFARMLLQSGADRTITDRPGGENPADIARREGNDEMGNFIAFFDKDAEETVYQKRNDGD